MNEQAERIRYKLNPFQHRARKAIETNKRIIALFAGWRTGKTDYMALKHIITRQLYHNPDVLHLISANTYSQLIDSTLRPLYNWTEKLGILRDPKELPRGHSPFSIFLHNGEKWVEFLIRSMENIDSISGTTLGSAWGDEMWGTEKWTYDLINSRLSDMRSKYLQFVITSNTDEPDHWLYTDIVQKWEINKKSKEGLYPRDIIDIVYGTTYDNKDNLPAGYIEGMSTTLDTQMFERFILSKWVSLGKGKMFYKFSREKNVSKTLLLYEQSLPLMVSSDFNVDPMCWSIWQQHKEQLWCIDQIMVKGNADTELCCRELFNRYPQAKRIEWFGDASGKHNDTRSQNSDYDIIRQSCRRQGIELSMHVPLSNPSVRDSANAVNVRLENANGEVNVLFDGQKCPDVILSVEGTNYKPGTNEKDDSKDKDPNNRVKTHFGDTVRYIANQKFPLRTKAVWSQG